MNGDLPLPYLTLPIVSVCQLRCKYCNKDGSGEAYGAPYKYADLNEIFRIVRAAYNIGIRKFRITGGEPLLHPSISMLLQELSKFNDAHITVNTNGMTTKEIDKNISKGPGNTSYIVSLDTLKESVFDEIVGRNGAFHVVLNSIERLSKNGVLKRINMVVTKNNDTEIFDLIDFCRTIGCDLKISDIASPANINSPLESSYTSLEEVESALIKNSDYRIQHNYSKYYGIPQTIYSIDGVRVTVKNSKKGSMHSVSGPCQSCSHFPCEEGLYFIYANCDGTYSACRKKCYSVNEKGGIENTLARMASQLGEIQRVCPTYLKNNIAIQMGKLQEL